MTFMQHLRSPFRHTNGNATLIIIGINVLVYAFLSFARGAAIYLALIPGAVIQMGWVWQPFTYMFVHASFTHLLFNMLGLFFFGMAVEREMGSREFVLFYLLSGTVAGLLSFAAFAIGGAWNVSLVGASGAVYAILLAFAVIHPRARIFVWGLVPVPSALLVAIFAGIELWSEVFGMGGNIAHLTHLFGFGVAGLYFPIRFGVNPIRRLISGQ
ncbi:MAG: rhomboid family intramembrane serine protease [Spirochaetales bacterium]|nr:MAG: rhomboid family intramembrane serine protease [Spirochaetales bacterium]